MVLQRVRNAIAGCKVRNQLLIQNDAQHALRSLPSESVDAVVTSPPYNIGVQYGAYKDNRDEGDYLEWCRSWLEVLWRTLKSDGSLFLNLAGSSTTQHLPYRVLSAALDIGFRLQNEIIWVKSIHVPNAAALRLVRRLANRSQRGLDTTTELEALANTSGHTFGHNKPINSPRLLNRTHEFVFHLTKHGDVPIDRLAIGAPRTDPRSIRRYRTASTIRCGGNTWLIPYPTRQTVAPHPAAYPIELASRCLRLHFGKRRGIVLDPFSGTGTTALASEMLGLRSIGVELDESYHLAAVQRIAESDFRSQEPLT